MIHFYKYLFCCREIYRSRKQIFFFLFLHWQGLHHPYSRKIIFNLSINITNAFLVFLKAICIRLLKYNAKTAMIGKKQKTTMVSFTLIFSRIIKAPINLPNIQCSLQDHDDIILIMRANHWLFLTSAAQFFDYHKT